MGRKIKYSSFLVFLLLFSCVSKEAKEEGQNEENTSKQDTVTINEVEKDTVESNVQVVSEKDTILIVSKGNNGLYGYVDTAHNWVIQPQYNLAAEFSKKLAPVKKNGKWIIINKRGNQIQELKKLKPIVYHHELSGEEIVIPITEMILPIEFPDGKKGFLSLGSGKVSSKFDDVRNYSEDYAPVMINNKWGMINRKGQWLVQPIYDYVFGFHHGRARVKNGGKYGFINKRGVETIPLKYGSAYDFSDELAFVSQQDDFMNFFVIDTTGKTVLKGLYNQAFDWGFKNGEAEVFHNGKCIIIDKTGKKIRDSKYGCQEGC